MKGRMKIFGTIRATWYPHDVGSELLCLHSLNTNSEWVVAFLNANLLPGHNVEDQEMVVHINRIFLISATQGSPGLTSLLEQMGLNIQLHEREQSKTTTESVEESSEFRSLCGHTSATGHIFLCIVPVSLFYGLTWGGFKRPSCRVFWKLEGDWKRLFSFVLYMVRFSKALLVMVQHFRVSGKLLFLFLLK